MADALLRIAPRFTHVVEGQDTLVLIGDDDSTVLEGSGIADLIPLLDGSRNSEQIAAHLSQHPPAIVHLALLRLAQTGVLEPVGPPPMRPDGGGNTDTGLASLLSTAWRDRAHASVVAVPLENTTTSVMLAADYLEPTLPNHLDQTTTAGPVVLVKVGPVDIWLGPVFGVPGGACLPCLQERLRMNLAARALLHSSVSDETLRVWALGATVPESAFGRVAGHLNQSAAGTLLHPLAVLQDPFSGGASTHRVSSLPTCESCGEVTSVPPGSSVEIGSPPLTGDSGGGYRICDAETTWARYSSLISPLTGVVRRIEKVEAGDSGLIHAYTASHAGTYEATSVKAVKDDRRDRSGGKGITDLDARVSALCESLERCSAMSRGTEPTRRARLSELEPGGIHPNDVLGFSAAQYAHRDAWNADLSGGFQWVPEPYDDQAIDWVPLRSLTTGSERWLPASMIYHAFSGKGGQYCRPDSNGLAGGNCIEEAVLQGLLELIERDAIALWWYTRSRVPKLDLSSTSDERVRRVVDSYATMGRSMIALDLTTDLGVPCFAGVSALNDAEQEDIIFGFGCHVDAEIALRRAVTEVNQMLPTVLRPVADRKRQLLPDFKDAIDWWEQATLANQPYLTPAPGLTPRSIGTYERPDFDDLGAVVDFCVERLRDHDIEVMVHDLSRADLGFSVAKVVAPGLRHFWRRLGPGRLSEVPVKLGWQGEPMSESDMNPVSMFA